YYVNGLARITSATNILSAGQWHHIALSRNSGITKLYVDGVAVGSWTDSTNYTQDRYILGGISDTDTFPGLGGWLDEFRVTNGIGRFPDDFTPPDSPYTT
ncbi:LamG domain-containing protein, partial [Microbulbifer sp. OS29]